MNRSDFEALRDLPGKTIAQDIAFSAPTSCLPNLIFDGVPVENSMGYDIILNGTFKPRLKAITFNFVVRGVGPICRVCVNGTLHGDAGRTHKHDLQSEEDPRRNLPIAVARPDLVGLKPSEVWTKLLTQANITHVGKFHDPG
jgi:hypothetical protein